MGSCLIIVLNPFVDGIVRAKASICPHIFDVVLMRLVVKLDIFELIGFRHTKN